MASTDTALYFFFVESFLGDPCVYNNSISLQIQHFLCLIVYHIISNDFCFPSIEHTNFSRSKKKHTNDLLERLGVPVKQPAKLWLNLTR